ncbi:MAG TPA: potassium channel family protein [Mycobacteriales bacterium]|nr:potassium channel family protein [Mycobacteriales bacterium]
MSLRPPRLRAGHPVSGKRPGPARGGSAPLTPSAAVVPDVQASAAIFLIMRRMRAPLIILVLILAVSVLGLTLIPGQAADGSPSRMTIFDAFYFMSYTATTIGFGELPEPFTDAQRLWVLVSIYLTVVGWAYAIGALLTLMQDRAFRQALALQHFQRKVARLHEPFLLFAGYGQTGELLGRALDGLGRRFVVLDREEARIDALELASYHGDVPALAADARNPQHLASAGLGNPYCEGVLALTDDDEANLAVTMTTALLRPDLAVVARTVSPQIAQRMRAFGTPSVVNPFDRFGDHLGLALRAPASFQLLSWLEAGPDAALPPRGAAPRVGRWVVCGYGRFGRELTADLRAEGLDVTVIESVHLSDGENTLIGTSGAVDADVDDDEILIGDGSEPAVMARADLEHAVGLVAGTDNDTTNLSLVAAARRVNPKLFVTARQNRPANAPLFAAMRLDALLVPAEVVAHEIYAQLSTPLLWRFLVEMPAQGDDWAAGVIERLTDACGHRLPAIWKLRLTPQEAPALQRWLAAGRVQLADLLRDPEDRDQRLPGVPLLVLRSGESLLAPAPDHVLAAGDELLMAGTREARRSQAAAQVIDGLAQYVVTGRRQPSSWVWRRLGSGRAA